MENVKIANVQIVSAQHKASQSHHVVLKTQKNALVQIVSVKEKKENVEKSVLVQIVIVEERRRRANVSVQNVVVREKKGSV